MGEKLPPPVPAISLIHTRVLLFFLTQNSLRVSLAWVDPIVARLPILHPYYSTCYNSASLHCLHEPSVSNTSHHPFEPADTQSDQIIQLHHPSPICLGQCPSLSPHRVSIKASSSRLTQAFHTAARQIAPKSSVPAAFITPWFTCSIPLLRSSYHSYSTHHRHTSSTPKTISKLPLA